MSDNKAATEPQYIRICYCENSSGHACHCVDSFFHADGDCRSVRVDDGTNAPPPATDANAALVVELRSHGDTYDNPPAHVIARAADRIESLRGEVERLKRIEERAEEIHDLCDPNRELPMNPNFNDLQYILAGVEGRRFADE